MFLGIIFLVILVIAGYLVFDYKSTEEYLSEIESVENIEIPENPILEEIFIEQEEIKVVLKTAHEASHTTSPVVNNEALETKADYVTASEHLNAKFKNKIELKEKLRTELLRRDLIEYASEDTTLNLPKGTIRTDTIPGIDYEFANIESDTLIEIYKTIYKEDSRLDYYSINQPEIKTKFKSVLGICNTSDFQEAEDEILPLTKKYISKPFKLKSNPDVVVSFCTDGNIKENFLNQYTLPYCTAVVYDSLRVITALHCLPGKKISDIQLIFDYYINYDFEANEFLDDHSYDQSTIYGVSNVSYYNENDDVAILTLDKKIPQSRIPEYDYEHNYKKNTKVYTIGHPSGLPLKYSGNGLIFKENRSPHFDANLDAFRGNSGSPVFDEETNKIIGILLKGNIDFVFSKESQCIIPKIYEKNPFRGETILKINQIK